MVDTTVMSKAQEPPGPGKRSRPRLWIFLAIPLALVLIAWGTLAILFPPARLKDLVRRQIGTSLAREVRFRDAGLRLWPPVRLTVDEFALAEPGGFGRGAALRAKAVHLDLDVLALLGRRVVVKRLVLDGPSLHLVLKPDGGTNLDSLGAQPGPSRPAQSMDLALERIDITGGQVLIDDLPGKRRTLFDVETRSSLSLTRAGAVRSAGESHVRKLRFGPLSAVADSQLDRSFARLDWKVGHDATYEAQSQKLAIGKLAVVFGDTEIGLQGLVTLAEQPPVVDLRARGTGIDLGEMLDYLSVADARMLNDVRGSGRLEFDLAIRGALAGQKKPQVTGTFAVRDGAFSYPGLPVGVEALSFSGRLAPDSLTVPDLEAQVSGQVVRAHLQAANFENPRVRFGLAGDIDLAATSRLIADPETKLAGRMAVDVTGQGLAKDPGSIALNGWARLENASVLSPKLPKRIDQLYGQFRFSNERATIQGLRAVAGKSSFQLDASATRPLALIAQQKPDAPPVAPSQIDFTLNSDYLDLEELVAPTPGGPLLPNARGKGRIAIQQLKQGRLDVENVRATVDLTPTEIVASPFSFSGYGGSVSGKAHIDVADPNRPRVRLDARVDSTRADALLSTWTGAGKLIHGILGSTLELATDGITPQDVRRSLTAKGNAKVTNGTLGPAPLFEAIARFTRVPAFQEVKFRDFHTAFRVENGRVATGPARLTGAFGEWQLAGTTSFEGGLDYAVSVTLPPELVAKLGATGALAAGALADPQGRVLLDLRVTGNAKAPHVAWDAAAMRDRLLGKPSAALLAPVLGGRTVSDTLNTLRRAAEDSARAEARRLQRALEDSLKKAARDALKKLFGNSETDTTKQ
jgi:hypothetical protein